MGCLPQSTSFKVIEFDFLTYLLIDVKPWSFVREFELSMQLVLMMPLVIHRGLFATSSFVEGRPLVPSFANVIGVIPLLQASEFYHVRLMKASPKLPFIVVIVIFSILFSSHCSCLFFVESLLYTQQNIYQNIA